MHERTTEISYVVLGTSVREVPWQLRGAEDKRDFPRDNDLLILENRWNVLGTLIGCSDVKNKQGQRSTVRSM